MKNLILCAATVAIALGLQTTASAQDSAVYDTALLTIVNDTIIAAEAPGIVRDIAVEAGSDVDNEEVLVKLNQESFEAEVNVTKARLAIAKLEASDDINIRFAAKSLEVNCKLLKRSLDARRAYEKSISKNEVDRLELEVQQAKLSREQAESQQKIASQNYDLEFANLGVAALNLDNRNVRAPFAGRVEQLFVQTGQWISAGAPIARVVDLKQLRIKAIFNQRYILGIKPGNQAMFSYSIGDTKFETSGRVTFVSSEIKNEVFQVWVDIDNSELSLLPGVQGKLEIELQSQK